MSILNRFVLRSRRIFSRGLPRKAEETGNPDEKGDPSNIQSFAAEQTEHSNQTISPSRSLSLNDKSKDEQRLLHGQFEANGQNIKISYGDGRSNRSMEAIGPLIHKDTTVGDNTNTIERGLTKESCLSAPQIYENLDESKNEIRLLEILPDEVESPVFCKLRHVSLDDDPAFTALSYAWGDPTQTVPILVDGQLVPITENLEAALRQLRADGVTSLWADALCINQTDLLEKNHQVQKMKNIYQHATRVIAWLGVESGTSHSAMDSLSKLGKVANSFGISDIYSSSYQRLDTVQRERLSGLIMPYFSDEASLLTLKSMRGIRQLFDRPWFSRLWVIQEVVLARFTVLVCGKYKVEWLDFCAAIALFEVAYFVGRSSGNIPSKLIECLDHCLRSVGPASKIWARIKYTGVYLGLSTLLGYSCWETVLKTSNPRDRVYALLGLLKEKQRGKIEVEYSLTCRDVYTQAAIVMLKQEGFAVLEYCDIARNSPTNDLPSWVPDWSSQINEILPVTYRYKASKSEGGSSLYKNACAVSGILSLTGAWVDMVNSTIPFPRGYSRNPTRLESLVTKLKIELARSNEIYGSPQKASEAIWRTLTLDRNWKTKGRADDTSLQELQKRVESHQPYTMFGFRSSDSCKYLISQKGYLCVGTKATEAGDQIFLPVGSEFPIVLRRGEGGRFRLVSTAYVHGIMYGEFMEQDPPIVPIEIY